MVSISKHFRTYFFTGFSVLLVIYCLYQIQYSYPAIVGYDGYYHIRIAQQMFEKGLLSSSPSLMYVPVEKFVDHHFLYHILLIPFTFGDLLAGAKNSSLFFDFFLVISLAFLFIKMNVSLPYIWILLIPCLSETFLFRLSLPRAPVVAVIFLLWIWYFMGKKNYKLLFILSFIFPFLYGGFISAFILVAGVSISELLVCRKFDIKTILSIFSGTASGVIINPFFPGNVKFIYLQATSAGLLRTVRGGGEWSSFSPEEFILKQFPVLALFFVSVYLLALSRKKSDSSIISLFFISAIMLAMSFKWRRFIEFAVPFIILFTSLVFRDCIDDYLSLTFLKNRISSRSFVSVITALLLIFLVVQTNAGMASVSSDRREIRRYSEGAKWLYENAVGMGVYLTDWDDYPELYFYNSKNKYLIGLDPAFLYLYDKKMYNVWNNINKGRYEGNLRDAFIRIFRTPVIFTDYAHGDFIRLVEKDASIKLEYYDSQCKIYKVLPE